MGRIVLDTHALIYDALTPKRLSPRARKAIEAGFADRELACCEISLWEIAILIARKRLDPVMEAQKFIDDMIAATALLHRANLATSDAKLRKLTDIATIW